MNLLQSAAIVCAALTMFCVATNASGQERHRRRSALPYDNEATRAHCVRAEMGQHEIALAWQVAAHQRLTGAAVFGLGAWHLGRGRRGIANCRVESIVGDLAVSMAAEPSGAITFVVTGETRARLVNDWLSVLGFVEVPATTPGSTIAYQRGDLDEAVTLDQVEGALVVRWIPRSAFGPAVPPR